MPLSTQAVESDLEIVLSDWFIADRSLLIRVLAHLVAGRAAHVRKVLGEQPTQVPTYSDSIIDEAVGMLEIGDVPRDSPLRIHRDGWLFQLMSWVVCFREFPGLLIRAPQPRKADKGFDGLVIRVDDGKVAWLLICEDKATDDPRGTVRGDVWNEFGKLELGSRDNELTSEAEALLSQLPGIDPAAVTADPKWFNDRRYRASVSCSRGSLTPNVHTFDGYSAIVAGDAARRSGNLFVHDDLRDFMAGVAAEAIDALNSMRPA